MKPDRETRISKYISLLLRHHPEKAGLTLDEHGWAEVEALLAGVSRRYPLDMATLEHIVAADEKQRYAFNPDHTRIRANQGHSIPVDVEPEERTPPELLWHGTGEGSTASIRREGLRPMGRLFVHLSADADTAWKVGRRHGRPVVLTVSAGAMHRDGFVFYRAANGVWLTGAVPPQYLQWPGEGREA